MDAPFRGGRVCTAVALLADGETDVARRLQLGSAAVDTEAATTTLAVAEYFGMAGAAILHVLDRPRGLQHLLQKLSQMESDRERPQFEKLEDSHSDVASRFLDLGQAYLAELATPVETSEKFVQSMLGRHVEPDRRLLLLRLGTGSIGFLHTKIDREERPGSGYILEFHVVPKKPSSAWDRRMFILRG